MLPFNDTTVGYVVKRYPRFSETFIVNEILAHEAAGMNLEIFALKPPVDTHFQDAISRVRASVTYLPQRSSKATDVWRTLHVAAGCLPGFWNVVGDAADEDVETVYQAATLACMVRERGISHLHAHFASSPASVARLAAHMANVPFTFTAHAKDIFHESVDPADLRRKLADAARVVTVSDFNARYLRNTFGPEIAPVERIYNGLDLELFRYRPTVERGRKIIAVGRLVEKKGFRYLVDACALLARGGVPFTCEIVGSGPEEDGLRQQITDLGLDACVRLTGPMPQRDVIDAVQGAAVFAAPCIEGTDGNRDGLPTVLLEAMALGTPCVSTPVTGIPEAVRHGETGLLVPEADPIGLAVALEQVLDNPELASNLASNGRGLIESDFDVQQNTATLRSFFTGAPLLARAS